MKAFYIILLTFCLMICGIFLNKVQVNKFADDNVAALQSIELSDSAKTVNAVTEKLLRTLEKLKFSIPQKKVNIIRNYTELLNIQHDLGIAVSFETIRKLLINQLNETDEAERISFSNIF